MKKYGLGLLFKIIPKPTHDIWIRLIRSFGNGFHRLFSLPIGLANLNSTDNCTGFTYNEYFMVLHFSYVEYK